MKRDRHAARHHGTSQTCSHRRHAGSRVLSMSSPVLQTGSIEPRRKNMLWCTTRSDTGIAGSRPHYHAVQREDPMHRLVSAASLSLIIMTLGGCPHPKMDARTTARTFYKRLASGKPGQAYDLLDPATSRHVSKQEFEANLSSKTKADRAMYRKLAADAKLVSSRRLIVRLGNARKLVLEENGSGWKITSNPFAFYPQDTPRKALRSFLAALQHKRYEILMRFVPRTYRRRMSKKDLVAMFSGKKGQRIRELTEVLIKHLDAPMEIHGNKATLVYGDGATVTLVREEGVWRIEDIQ